MCFKEKQKIKAKPNTYQTFCVHNDRDLKNEYCIYLVMAWCNNISKLKVTDNVIPQTNVAHSALTCNPILWHKPQGLIHL